MPARAFDRNAQAGRSCNAGDDSDRNCLLLEEGTLLDVLFDNRFVVAVRQFHFFKRCVISGIAANFFE